MPIIYKVGRRPRSPSSQFADNALASTAGCPCSSKPKGSSGAQNLNRALEYSQTSNLMVHTSSNTTIYLKVMLTHGGLGSLVEAIQHEVKTASEMHVAPRIWPRHAFRWCPRHAKDMPKMMDQTYPIHAPDDSPDMPHDVENAQFLICVRYLKSGSL